MKLLIVGPNSIENRLLLKAAKNRKHQAQRVSVKELTVVLRNNKFFIYYKNVDIANYNVCLIRGIAPYFAKAKTVAQYLNQRGVRVFDKELYNQVYEFDKIFMARQLSASGVPCPDTYAFSSLKEYQILKNKFAFPVILKDIQGMHGRNIFFIENKKDFLKFFSEHDIKKFFIQTVLGSDYYYRVLVVGNEVLGNMRRCSLKFLSKNKLSINKRSTFEPLKSDLRKLGIKATRAAKADIAGVDVMPDKKGNYFVLEVNRSPNFKRFTEVMKVNVAEEIVKYLEKK